MAKRHTAVILPGWNMHSDRYVPFVALLTEAGFRVETVSFPGFPGGEAITAAYTLADYESYLQRFLDEKRITSPILIGHSFGGRVALRYAARHPSVPALILTGTPGFRTTHPVKYAASWVAAKAGRAAVRMMGLQRSSGQFRDTLYRVMGVRDFGRAGPVLRETFRNITRESLVPYMEQVHMPCLLVWGEADTLVPVQVAKRMNGRIVSSVLERVPGADHMFPCTQPEWFIKRILPFLTTI